MKEKQGPCKIDRKAPGRGKERLSARREVKCFARREVKDSCEVKEGRPLRAEG